MMRIFWRLTPYRFLSIFALVLTFMLMVMIMDSVRDCDREELLSLRQLLQKYSHQIKDLTKSQTNLLSQLKTKDSNKRAISTTVGRNEQLPVIYLITPTYARPEQKAELTRLSHTFKLVPNVHWIVIEDSDVKTPLVTKLLNKTGLNYTHLNALTPPEFKMASKDPNWLKPRGVLQRNAALSWLRFNTSPSKNKGIVYFADDDNTYSLDIFEEMRFTNKVSVWPVGLVGYLRYERPIVENGKVVRWFTYWKPDRPFAMDMAGFAVNLQLIHLFPLAGFSNMVQRGYQESHFLTGLEITRDMLEPKAKLCSEILVWHTRTEKSQMKNEAKMSKKFGYGSDPNIEV